MNDRERFVLNELGSDALDYRLIRVSVTRARASKRLLTPAARHD